MEDKKTYEFKKKCKDIFGWKRKMNKNIMHKNKLEQL